MGRALRVAPAGGFFHVTTRGNRRQDVYLDEIDRSWFLSLLADVVKRFEWNLLAYCEMTNHYHLVVHTAKATLSAGMQGLNGVHAQRFNWRHGVQGHLFERPFRCRLAGSDEHLRELVRYVVLNPVRAGLYREPGEWPWSSYRASAGHVPAPGFLDVERLYRLFELPGSSGQVRFVEFAAAGHGLPSHDQGPGPETRLEVSGAGGQPPKRRTTMQALWPPKPNEFEHATSMSGASRASFGM
jgi:putative transposase